MEDLTGGGFFWNSLSRSVAWKIFGNFLYLPILYISLYAYVNVTYHIHTQYYVDIIYAYMQNKSIKNIILSICNTLLFSLLFLF